MIHTLHNANLQQGQSNSLVARLHRILDITGFPAQPEDTLTFGEKTKKAVVSFQKEFSIDPADGIVTKATAKVMENMYLENKFGIPHHITGTVIDKRTSNPVANAMVQVYESDVEGDTLLDETNTNTKGIYNAAFDEMAYGFDEKLTPDLYFQVYYNDKLLLSTKDKVEKAVPQGTHTFDFELEIVQSGEPNGYSLQGLVKNAEGNGLSKVTVQAYDLDFKAIAVYATIEKTKQLQAGSGFELLGETTSQEDGFYDIAYTNKEFAKSERRNADVIVFAIKNGTIIGRSAFVQNAATHARDIDVIFDEQQRTAGEYKGYRNQLIQFLNENNSKLVDVKGNFEQIAFIAAELNLPEQKIDHIILADAMANVSNIFLEPELLYGLYEQGTTTDWEDIFQVSVEMHTEALQKAINVFQIDHFSNKNIEAFIKDLNTVASTMLLDAAEDDVNSVNRLLEISLSKKKERVEFLKLQKQFTGTTENEFWDEFLPKHSTWADKTIRSLKLDHELISFTGNNVGLVKSLKSAKIDDSKKLVAFNKKEWLKHIGDTSIPDFIKGDTKKVRSVKYANHLEKSIYSKHSTTALSKHIDADKIPFKNKETGTLVNKFLVSSPEFDIKVSRIDAFKEPITETIGNELDAATVFEELKSLQRLTRINPDTTLIPVLRANNQESASSIAYYSEQKFLSDHTTDLGGKENALNIYANASNIVALAETAELSIVGHINNFGGKDYLFDPIDFKEIEKKIDTSFPGYSNIFNLSLCECQHCNSVYSPAAYFVDLMQFLSKGSVNEEGQDPLQIFRKRRPDLFHLPLTCENTNTLTPYIDLVNEVLENYLSQPSDFKDYKSADTGDLTADELRAHPQNIVRETYRKLADLTFYPASLPFHLPLEELRSFTEQMSTSWYELVANGIEALSSDPDEKRNMVNAAYFGISQLEFRMITQKNFDGTHFNSRIHEYYGFSNNSGLNRLARVPEFLKRTGLKYTEVINLIHCRFINPTLQQFGYLEEITGAVKGLDGAAVYSSLNGFVAHDEALLEPITKAVIDQGIEIVEFQKWLKTDFNDLKATITLFEPESKCDLLTTRIQTLGQLHESNDTTDRLKAADYRKIYAFLKLSRKSGLKFSELDQLLTALETRTITPEILESIVIALKLRDETGLGIKVIAVLLGTMGYWHENSLYDALFSDKTIEINSAFQNSRHIEPLSEGILNIEDSLVDLIAVFEIDEIELLEIFKFNAITMAAKLTLNDVNAIYKFKVLASICGISLPELVNILVLLELQPFTTPKAMYVAIDQIKTFTSSNFEVHEAAFLLNHTGIDYGELPPSKADIEKSVLLLSEKFDEIDRTVYNPDSVMNDPLIKKEKRKLLINELNGYVEMSSNLLTAYGETAFTDFIDTGVPNDHTVDLSGIEKNFSSIVVSLRKAQLISSNFQLSEGEFLYIDQNSNDFGSLDFDNLNLSDWERLTAFGHLKQSLPNVDSSLELIFGYAKNTSPFEIAALQQKMVETTGWNEVKVAYLLPQNNDGSAFINELELIRMNGAIQLASRMGISTASLQLLVPKSGEIDDFDSLWGKAQAVKKTLKSKYSYEKWQNVATKLNDQLREKKRDALVSKMLVTEEIPIEWRKDANSLYEYLLLDVQMSACMDTSRIVQASAAIQQFVNRVQLNLEKQVKQTAFDKVRWQWMKQYRVWEAQLRIWYENINFLNPEWRMDKSEFFEDFESFIVQNDINDRNAEEALRNYLKQLDKVSHIHVAGSYMEKKKKTLHVFGHSNRQPYTYYYRTYNQYGKWSAWSIVKAGIQAVSYAEHNFYGNKTGVHMTPVVWKNRLYLFWLEFLEKQKETNTGNTNVTDLAKQPIKPNKPKKYWEVRLAWSEFYNQKWTPKEVSECFTIINQSRIEPYRISLHTEILENSLRLILRPLISDSKWVGEYFEIFNINRKIKHYVTSGSKENGATVINTYNSSDFSIKSFLNDSETAKILFPSQLVAMNPIGNKSKNPISYPFFYTSLNKTYFIRQPDLDYELIEELGQNLGLFELRRVSKLREFNTFYQPYVSDFIENLNYRGIRSGDSTKPGLLESDYADLYEDKLSANEEYGFVKTFDPNFQRVYDPGSKLSNPLKTYFKENICFDPNGAYSLYNWELFYHAPLYLATELSKNGKFKEALKWFHAIFDPTTDEEKEGENHLVRFWKVKSFRHYAEKGSDPFNEFIDALESGTGDNKIINEWRDNAFDPHKVAASFPINYMKHVILAYVENLVNWGDSLFRKFTRENVYEATQMYVIAQHILGPKPEFIPERGKKQVQTYDTISAGLNDLSNARVALENSLGYSSNMSRENAGDNNTEKPGKLSGSGLVAYFCIPVNEKLMGYWETVDDRLFKIRNCKDINGITKRLALFAPPIDPAALVSAKSKGLDLGSILDSLGSPISQYRFDYLIQRALDVNQDVKQLGSMLLSTLEKKDGEELSQIRVSQETGMLQLVQSVKERNVQDAKMAAEGVIKQRENAIDRFKYYNETILGNEAVDVPALIELAADLNVESQIQLNPDTTNIEPDVNVSLVPGDSEGLKIIPKELEDIQKRIRARELSEVSGALELAASVYAMIPQADAEGTPLGVGVGVTIGGIQLSSVAQSFAKVAQIVSGGKSHEAALASTNASYIRREQDWTHQANLALKEISVMERQILSANIRVQVAEKDLEKHHQQIKNAEATEAYITTKFSNKELYQWMKDRLMVLHKQSFDLAFEMAKKAELAYQFERDMNTSNIIEYNYWDSSKYGLLAGEGLQLGLRQLQKAYQEANVREYEVNQSFSMRRLNPEALLQLKVNGDCNMIIPEWAFDLFYPGQYKRKIKSVRISIPCVTGPNVNVGAKLSLEQSWIRNEAIADKELLAVAYQGHATVATSNAQMDGGVFELNFRDERYLPFEGAGAVSSWNLSLPSAFKAFDYNTINDVLFHISYTAKDDGALKTEVESALSEMMAKIDNATNPQGLTLLLDLKHDFPNEWHRFMNGESFVAQILDDHYPYFTMGKEKENQKVFLFDENGDGDEIVQISLSNNNQLLIDVVDDGDVRPCFAVVNYGMKSAG